MHSAAIEYIAVCDDGCTVLSCGQPNVAMDRYVISDNYYH